MRLGIMGSGDIVSSTLKMLKFLPQYKVCTLFCRKESEARGKLLAEKYSINRVYTNIEAFLRDSSFDIVYVAVVNNIHYDYVKKSLLEGKHVICEKPLTSSYQNAKELYELAKQKKCILYEMNRSVLTLNFQYIKNHVSELGNITLASTSLCHCSRRYNEYQKGNILPVFDVSKNGGALYDLGIYCIHFFVGLFGKPKSVQYISEKGYNKVDLSGILILKYSTFIATASIAKNANGPAYFTIQGDKGYIYSNTSAMYPGKTIIRLNHQEENIIAHDSKELYFSELKMLHMLFKENNIQSFEQYLQDSLICMQIIDEAIRSDSYEN